MQAFSLKLPPELRERLDRAARLAEVSTGAFARDLLEKAFTGEHSTVDVAALEESIVRRVSAQIAEFTKLESQRTERVFDQLRKLEAGQVALSEKQAELDTLQGELAAAVQSTLLTLTYTLSASDEDLEAYKAGFDRLKSLYAGRR